MATAAAIGTPVRVDRNTLGVARGRFARVCVEIELQKPVIGKFWLNGNWCKVEYEGLHCICTNCDCFGHPARDCTKQTTPRHGRAATSSTEPGKGKSISNKETEKSMEKIRRK